MLYLRRHKYICKRWFNGPSNAFCRVGYRFLVSVPSSVAGSSLCILSFNRKLEAVQHGALGSSKNSTSQPQYILALEPLLETLNEIRIAIRNLGLGKMVTFYAIDINIIDTRSNI